eukprot:TRINITY_DN31236_c0_g1_i1.p1 TRINITY_DN31236_c0_g1~~TRINITY_DN31236_c0_g1_i1.p1  ORF type:complete len:154 (+),score=23.19 TRINITY_DN31236_c0_g1_i1:44-505(+)
MPSKTDKQKVGVTVRDVPASDFIATYAKHLKRSGRIEIPNWADLVKGSAAHELSFYNPEWFYIRVASIARQVYFKPQGVGTLRRHYGRNKRKGAVPNRQSKVGSSILRAALKNLEKLGVLEKPKEAGGRRITFSGRRDLDRIAGRIVKANLAK